MASLKFLAALKVSTCSGVAELDDYVSQVHLFDSGESQKVPEGILDYHTYATCVLGNRFFANGDNTFFLNKRHLLDGPSDMWESGALMWRTWYRDGEKHGTETQWWCPKRKRMEGRWEDGRKVGEHKRWNRDGWLAETSVYSEDGKTEKYNIYSLSEKDKVVYSAFVKAA
ncbi:MORN repeat-containing protein [Marseillevirus marseillevirus]|uniref:MORN repeat-containing protein n=1 Tax=Marseillevirus marseillevirus TaxID=694581 RepID=D2XAD1_GBMV|nr:MORN repeat-containing protein [Marseillevirus marseillevirus]ADB03908.1 MORN repeat-containing protein [Marseillevirus marseillevirus]